MKETGLMFKAPLVRAILSGQKTQTRRVLRNQRAYDLDKCPFGQPGDRIYVRETFGYGGDAYTPDMYFRASQQDAPIQGCWHPAIHMHKADARIWLEVTGVRVERLQSISRGDAMAEGCPFPNIANGEDPRKWFAELWDSTTDRPALPTNTASKRYARIKHWLDTHPDNTSWAANPWVWVIDFKRIEKP